MKTIEKTVKTIDGDKKVLVRRLSYNEVFKINKLNVDYQEALKNNDTEKGKEAIKQMFSLIIGGGELPDTEYMLENYPIDDEEEGLMYILQTLLSGKLSNEDKKK